MLDKRRNPAHATAVPLTRKCGVTHGVCCGNGGSRTTHKACLLTPRQGGQALRWNGRHDDLVRNWAAQESGYQSSDGSMCEKHGRSVMSYKRLWSLGEVV